MCGIVAACTERNVVPILLAGLHALEYRGYDSAGLAVLDQGRLVRLRTPGKVASLDALCEASPVQGRTGIAHTRWATHGAPNEANAHPHISRGAVAVVHNGIIENHAELREELQAAGYVFTSETDTEVIAHLIHKLTAGGKSLQEAVAEATHRLRGAFAIVAIHTDAPGHVVGTRRGSPLCIGIGIGERFMGSDVHALIQVTNRIVYLDEGDVADITCDTLVIHDAEGQIVTRQVRESNVSLDAVDRGDFRHYMLKEICEQPTAVANTLEGRLANGHVLPHIFGADTDKLLQQVRCIHVVACGTSFHAGMVMRYWVEGIAGIPCTVEVASEYRYRHVAVAPGTLFLAISQSGETADTLAALRDGRARGYLGSFAICNVPESSLVRESDLTLMTRAGPEIGVASTKAFTTQLAALALLVLELARMRGIAADRLTELVAELDSLPRKLNDALELGPQIAKLAESFVDKRHALFLGRGAQYPVAMEGALKLKEISYIHAEAYPAGELKHGPLALVDEDMPIIAVAPNNQLLEKLKSNLEEVRARGGQLYVFADVGADVSLNGARGQLVSVDTGGHFIAPAVLTVLLQLLAYHVAVQRGTDVDQPRNLAKSVTVE
jgi:glucosamine--fructose-6-phosphate aminotransferase (isomerizing)